MQFCILLVGVMVFVFYQFNSSPLNFNPKAEEAVIKSEYAQQYKELQRNHKSIEEEKKVLFSNKLTEESKKQLIFLG